MSRTRRLPSAPPPPDPTQPPELPAAAPPNEDTAPQTIPDPYRDARPAERETPVGTKLGRYRVCFELASGGMATVYLARLRGEAGFEKVVALKCIHPHLARDRHFVDMFLDEARIASYANHPHVCQIFDFGEADGTYYLAMEYVSGEPLSRVLQTVVVNGHRLHPMRYRAMVARIIGDACEALHAVHEMRDANGRLLEVVHRDVSPQNLFISFDGVVKLMDFGIARANHQTHRTTTGEIKGNMPYIAPEQVRGKGVDRRADVWSLGVLLWEMLAGQRLFKRDTTVKTMYAVLNDPIPRLDDIIEGFPSEYADVVDRTLQRDAAERWSTARDLGLALQQVARANGGWPSVTELAEWMDRLFPDGRQRHQQRVAVAREVADGVTKPTSTTSHRRRTVWTGWSVGIAGVLLGTAIAVGVDEEQGAGAGRQRGPGAAATGKERSPPPGGSGPAAAKGRHASGAAASDPDPAGGAGHPPGPDATAVAAEGPDGRAGESGQLAAGTAETTPRKEDQGPGTRRERGGRPGEREARRNRERRGRARQRGASTNDKGRLNVVTPDGWAVVYRRGTRLGQTPLQLELPVGEHVLTLRPFGDGPVRRIRAQVDGEGTSRISVRLER